MCRTAVRWPSRGVGLSLSVDNTVLFGRTEMFELMKLAADLGDGFARE